MSEFLSSLVEQWLAAKRAEEEARKLKDELAAQIIGSGEDPKPFGVAIRTRTGGYSDGLVPLLKAKGLRNAYRVVEKPDSVAIKTLLANGVLTDSEVGPFKQPDSVYLVELKGGA